MNQEFISKAAYVKLRAERDALAASHKALASALEALWKRVQASHDVGFLCGKLGSEPFLSDVIRDALTQAKKVAK